MCASLRPSMASEIFGKGPLAPTPILSSMLFKRRKFFGAPLGNPFEIHLGKTTSICSGKSLPKVGCGRWGGASENLWSHGWRNTSATWTCRRSAFQKRHPNGHPLRAKRPEEPKHPSPKIRTYTSEAPGEPPWPDALRRDRRPTAEPERNRTMPSAGNHRR